MTIIDEVNPKTSTQRKTSKSSNSEEIANSENSPSFVSVLYYPNLMSPPKTQLSSLTFSGLKSHRITLLPGTNLLSQEQLKFLESCQAFKDSSKLNATVVKLPTNDNVDVPDSLMGHNIKDALEIIANCNGSHLPKLRLWLQTSRRNQIQNSLSKKINSLSGG